MKQASYLCVCFLVLGTVMLPSCARSKYADAKHANRQYIKIVEAYVAELDQAQDAPAVAQAINNFAAGMEKIWPAMQRVTAKYPELKNKDSVPKELQELEKKAEALAGKMAESMMKIAPHMGDPAVQAAQQRLEAAMAGTH